LIDVFYVTAVMIPKGATELTHIPRTDMGKFYEAGHAEDHREMLRTGATGAYDIRVELRQEEPEPELDANGRPIARKTTFERTSPEPIPESGPLPENVPVVEYQPETVTLDAETIAQRARSDAMSRQAYSSSHPPADDSRFKTVPPPPLPPRKSIWPKRDK
jgi:hypothetical protein